MNGRVRELYDEYPESMAYLSAHVFSVKEKFCYCYTKHMPTLGNSTTGRAEVTNWLLERRCRGSASLCQVICCSELVANDYTEKRRWMAVKQKLRRSLVKDLLTRSLIDLLPTGDLRNKVLVEVAGIISSDFHVAFQREDGDWACTCHFYENRLLPCRHIYAAKRAAVDIFTAADMHPMYQSYDLSPSGVSLTAGLAEAAGSVVTSVVAPALDATRQQSEGAGEKAELTTIADLKAMFGRSLAFAEVSCDSRERLRSLLQEFNEQAVVKGNEQSGRRFPGSARGRGRRSTKVQHNETVKASCKGTGPTREATQNEIKHRMWLVRDPRTRAMIVRRSAMNWPRCCSTG
jgi:hypothetical protein